MDKWSVAAVLCCLAFAGCSQPRLETIGPDARAAAPAGPGELLDAGQVDLAGHVFGPSLQPIEGAIVTLVVQGEVRVTDEAGAFHFGKRPRGLYALQVEAAGHIPLNYTVPPEAQGAASILMEAGRPVVPYQETMLFRGLLDCALEAAIISPSCDSAVTAFGGPAAFREDQSFVFPAALGWKTLVLDVVFDGESHPGLDGLRAVVRGSHDPDSSGEYQQYGRWSSPASFTVRIEPGGEYPEGTQPVPAEASGFQVDVYPHSHGYQQACSPTDCLLGVGVAVDVRFEVYATLFYVEPAPQGWTLLEGSR